jgi:iron-sulfur cluster assembly protein
MTNDVMAPVSFTEGALKEIKKLQEQPGIEEGMALRVGVKGGGCSGLSYVLGFDHKQEDDLEYEIQGIKVLMNKAHGLYLMGMQIDFPQGLNARGFVFENPNASSSCGCGSSFAV